MWSQKSTFGKSGAKYSFSKLSVVLLKGATKIIIIVFNDYNLLFIHF